TDGRTALEVRCLPTADTVVGWVCHQTDAPDLLSWDDSSERGLQVHSLDSQTGKRLWSRVFYSNPGLPSSFRPLPRTGVAHLLEFARWWCPHRSRRYRPGGADAAAGTGLAR